MTIRPILFSGPMVRAILDGRKTQTRRTIKLPTKTHDGGPIYERPDMGGWEATTIGGGGCFRVGRDGERIAAPERSALWHRTTGTCLGVGYSVGDLLWVRETWAPTWRLGRNFRWRLEEEGVRAVYPNTFNAESIRWTPSIHMPRWASRLTLEVTRVRVERLQDIATDDAIDEGLCQVAADDEIPFRWGVNGVPPEMWHANPVVAYAALWDSINGAGAWAANPWIVAVTFTVHKCNVSELVERAAA